MAKDPSSKRPKEQARSRLASGEVRFIGLKEAAARTNLSVSTLRRARDEGDLPSYMPQGKILLDIDEVDGWIRASRFKGRSNGSKSGLGKSRGSSDLRSEVMRRRGS